MRFFKARKKNYRLHLKAKNQMKQIKGLPLPKNNNIKIQPRYFRFQVLTTS